MDLYFNRLKITNIPINVRNELMLNLNFVDISITWMTGDILGMRDYIYQKIISEYQTYTIYINTSSSSSSSTLSLILPDKSHFIPSK